jgi:hypothetical protein
MGDAVDLRSLFQFYPPGLEFLPFRSHNEELISPARDSPQGGITPVNTRLCFQEQMLCRYIAADQDNRPGFGSRIILIEGETAGEPHLMWPGGIRDESVHHQYIFIFFDGRVEGFAASPEQEQGQGKQYSGQIYLNCAAHGFKT